MVELLVSRGANPLLIDHDGWKPLISAATNGRVAVVGYLLRIRAVRATIDAQDYKGRTALWWAAFQGHVGVVKLLVEAGVNPMIANDSYDGRTPMSMAQLRGHHQCIELLQVGQCSTVELRQLVVVTQKYSLICEQFLLIMAVVTH